MQSNAPLGIVAPADHPGLASPAARSRAGIAGWSIGTLALTGGLTILALIWLVPIVWIITTALKP